MKWRNYRKHPRILELAIMLIYKRYLFEYGASPAVEFIRALAKLVGVNPDYIGAILQQAPNIRRMEKTNRIRMAQEYAFTCYVYGFSKREMAKVLGLSRSTIYKTPELYEPDQFVDSKWLEGLDRFVTVCSQSVYSFDASRFIELYSDYAGGNSFVYSPEE